MVKFGQKYTPEEDAMIEAAYLAGEQCHIIADMIGRTRYSVEARVSKLKLYRGRIKPTATRTGCRWTPEEDAAVLANATRPIADIMAAVPGRTKGAIYERLACIGGNVEREFVRPMHAPFQTSSGVWAIRTRSGTIAYTPSIHDHLIGQP